ncbi:MAG: hypothetical protein HY700_05620 [Gemmatimonadetes bacterium]|nr:hypothetical protein [Gemmatimonadota bacterium]
MSARWSFGLLAAAVICCAAPLLIGAGLAGVAWGVVRQHWGWLVGGAGFVALVVFARLRRVDAP